MTSALLTVSRRVQDLATPAALPVPRPTSPESHLALGFPGPITRHRAPLIGCRPGPRPRPAPSPAGIGPGRRALQGLVLAVPPATHVGPLDSRAGRSGHGRDAQAGAGGGLAAGAGLAARVPRAALRAGPGVALRPHPAALRSAGEEGARPATARPRPAATPPWAPPAITASLSRRCRCALMGAWASPAASWTCGTAAWRTG